MKVAHALSLALVLSLVAGASSCTHEKALIVSGESLDAVGLTFTATAGAMNAELDRQGLNAETCAAAAPMTPAAETCAAYRKWAAFARKFKPAYASAVAVWKAAEASQDETLLRQAGAIVATLASELATFTTEGTHAR